MSVTIKVVGLDFCACLFSEHDTIVSNILLHKYNETKPLPMKNKYISYANLQPLEGLGAVEGFCDLEIIRYARLIMRVNKKG